MPIWHQSPKLTPRYFLETPRLFGYPLFTYNILFSIYALFKVNIINNCRRKFNYSLAFKLETISIVLIFLANNLFITYETKTVPMIAYT